MLSKSQKFAGVTAAVGVAVFAAVRLTGHPSPPPDDVRPSIPNSFLIQPEAPPYSEAWRTSESEAEASAKFKPVFPDTEAANPSRATAVYMSPDGEMVSITYPLVGTPRADVGQQYVEVWQTTWNPALLWFEAAGVEFQVSGGDNLDDLIAIAKDLIHRSTAG